ncbi:hypothetical protein CIN_17700 [Commensalibacter intestini A911]|uniref:Uncharacterized protein n=2 Tax=Commensalibacter intestini TaxID=479936 RepID=A0A251ZTT5_9PROT|nr:hypothetical protein [Commensalibacter intestini]EHD13578.1 hypothetical protein CIN_17700 [Commensalibacter intestini A911]OUI78071.1 hypothetical protein HK18_11050 [Commensalibacter intestini]
MDFYTGKPDRPIEHYGIVSYTFQQLPFMEKASGALKELFKNKVKKVEPQSDEEAMQSIKLLVLEKNSKTNVIYDMKISTIYVPAFYAYCMITKIYASYGRYKDE